jgi:formylglycine-generating enzyme required for sulfatase activity
MMDKLVFAVAEAVADRGLPALSGGGRFADGFAAVARGSLAAVLREIPADGVRMAVRELAGASDREFGRAVARALDRLAGTRPLPGRDALAEYLSYLPAAARHALRRPTDPTGRTIPEKLRFGDPDALLGVLPPRLPRFRPDTVPPHLGNWKLTELAGFGECSEVWSAADPGDPDHSPAAMKFVTDHLSAEELFAHQDLLVKVFDLNDEPGVVPLRAVHLDTDPPCLESPFVSGYDLTGVMFDWRFRYDGAKPEASLKLIRRLAEVVARAHLRGVVHRDLKPSNVLLHPTEGGRFTLWVTDFGWGQIAAARSADLARRGDARPEQPRLAAVGSYSPLYAAPQVSRDAPPDPRDDVYAIGAIWYQLLCREPRAAVPTDDWTADIASTGVTTEYIDLIQSCLSPDPAKRPKDAVALATAIANIPIPNAGSMDGSRILSVKGMQSASFRSPFAPSPAGQLARPPAVVALADPGRPILGARPHRDQPPSGWGGLPKQVKNSAGMTFVLVPPGTFKMGSEENEDGHEEDEAPRRTVTISRPFYLSVVPVTQAQFQAVTGRNPAAFRKGKGGGPDYPVESVTWFDAEEFCAALGRQSDETHAGRSYRLPTEAEWEYACRAGTSTPFSCGERLSPFDAHYLAASVLEGGAAGKTAPTGQFLANPFGLRDMHGNVGEWVSDWYDATAYRDADPVDPIGPVRGALKVVRGGSWATLARQCRSAARKGQNPEAAANTVGFRVVLAARKGERGA